MWLEGEAKLSLGLFYSLTHWQYFLIEILEIKTKVLLNSVEVQLFEPLFI